ncbi:MAG TPA: class I SAM-dependent methyltransferase [Bryobacteraceae bacterium]|nr:class I SAM-dependent methyltransferase [Bryobacteraceae bacterium]
MTRSFFVRYIEAFQRIEGWFQFDAALMFMAYNQLVAGRGIAGDVLEIGVHFGLSAIATAHLRGSGSKFYAVDLFEDLQNKNVSRSGAGNRGIFERNMGQFFDDLSFLQVLAKSSADIRPDDVGRSFSFCHIDGGHSRRETFGDLDLCSEILVPGGLLGIDDYFNVEHPGVCEGAVEFHLRKPGVLKPIAIGFNKVLFQKQPCGFDLNAEFHDRFPEVQFKTVQMWDQPAVLLPEVLRTYFDLQASTPRELRPVGAQRWATFAAAQAVRAKAGAPILMPVEVTNASPEPLPHGKDVFGLSYHLLSKDGRTISHDNARAYLKHALDPGKTIRCELPVATPREPGQYRLELDLVWEGVMWFRDIGNPTALVDLVVT